MTSNVISESRSARPLIFGIVAAITIVSLVVFLIRMVIQDEANADKRDAAMKPRATEISQLTQGAVSHIVVNNAHGWSSLGFMPVVLTLGTCPNVYGRVAMPEAPTSSTQVGALQIELPPVSGAGAVSYVDIGDPRFYDKALRSGLAQCVAGDKRLQDIGAK